MKRGTRKPKFDLLLIFGVLFFAVFGLPSFALAWGPSVHLWIGDTLIQTVGAALPLAGALLRRNARSFLYGCLAPDFYVGKGSHGYDGHSHNWAQGRKLYEQATTEGDKAFALGYMAHLAADIIGHNHFVPNNLYRFFGVHKLGHVYFELHADNLLDHSYVDMATELAAAGDHHEHDELLHKVGMKVGILPFSAKKRVFTSWVAFSGTTNFKSFLGSMRHYSEAVLRHDDVRAQIDLSLALAFHMLKDPTVPQLQRFDPIGANNIRLAAVLRKHSKRAGSYRNEDVPFPVPSELVEVRHTLAELSFTPGPDVRDRAVAKGLQLVIA